MRYDVTLEVPLEGSAPYIKKGLEVLNKLGVVTTFAFDNLIYQVGLNPTDKELLDHVKELYFDFIECEKHKKL